ncbi:type VI secretion system protein TssA [Hahella ganghwensis]|uniref:type VI secretion system protein TssA n=1 Tax=Hahella ganghwensis TaxID=286420 RepID=UPI000366191F|nr:type VI secretion system protein TssA [Hahella ganghwensis]
MASEPVIEIEQFLKPISEDSPAGPDLRENSDKDYSAVKTARRKIVSLAKAARFDPNVESELLEQWREIRRLGPTILKKGAKDLEVAAWLTEALLKLNGFVGLRDGFQLIKELVDNFWDDMHPQPDEDGMETRVYPLISLNGEDGTGTLILPIKNAPLFPDNDPQISLTSHGRLQEAMQINDLDERAAKIQDLGLSEEVVHQQVNMVDPVSAENYIADIDATMTIWAELAEVVDQKCRDADASDVTLPVSGIRNALEEVKDLYRQLLRSKLASQDPDQEANEETTTPNSGAAVMAHTGGTAVATGPIRNREDAINHLLVIANFFRTTEPHSPLCGAIERTANWAKLSLQDLLRELIPDEGARMHYALMTGIQIGEDATPVGQLAQTAKPTAPAPTPSASPQESSGESGWGSDSDPHSGF